MENALYANKKRCVERSAERAVMKAYPGRFGEGTVRAEGPKRAHPEFWIVWARNADLEDRAHKYCVWEFDTRDRTLHAMFDDIADDGRLMGVVLAKQSNVPSDGVCGAKITPFELTRDAVLAMPYSERISAVMKAAVEALEKSGLGAYDPSTVAVEPQSAYPQDWHLWTAYAGVKDGVSGHGKYAAWTLNLEDRAFSGGYYDIPDAQSLMEVLCEKRSC